MMLSHGRSSFLRGALMVDLPYPTTKLAALKKGRMD